ncbi:hypothetical protein BKA70DRAFT_1121311 [Coprinopsis sp. MPI-PUGE-AT-0042]|nr:hypothetical protein BKA70DRAFT_1121311 [Coprinopsis sp. MPI-PUGE-AT-0042]
MHAYIGEVPAIFTSAAFGEISRLRTLSTVGLRQKLLQAKLHSQEFQRASSTFCMVSGFRSLHANLARDSMHFVTRPLFRKEDRSTSFPTPRRGMFTNARADADPTRVRADNFALDANAEVPIYNARAAVDFNFKENLVNIDSVLPRWNDEVPYGSFVVIAYTVAVYRANNGNWTLSCNIRWVMLVGVPEEDNSA